MNCPLCNKLASTPTIFSDHELFICDHCGLRFIDDSMNSRQYYTQYFDTYRKGRESENAARAKQYEIDAKHLRCSLESGRLLDVGCSTGGFLKALDKLGAYALHGIDIDESAIDQATRDVTDPRYAFLSTDLLSYVAPAGSYDAIIFRGTFQYLGSALGASLERVRSLLKPNGKLFIYSLPSADSFLYFLLKEKWQFYHPIEHTLLFNERAIRHMCDSVPLTLLELSYPYLGTAYADPVKDYVKVQRIVQSGVAEPVPFWGNIMQLVCQCTQGGCK